MTAAALSQPIASPATREHDRLAEWLLLGQIIGVTFLQKLAVTLTADVQLFFGFILLAALTAIGVVFSRLEIRPVRCAFYLLAMALMSAVQLAHLDSFSLPSLIMLMLVHLPYIFGLRPGLARPGIELEYFVKAMAVLAGLGIAQYFAQYVIGTRLAFPVEHFIPEAVRVEGFNSLNPVRYMGEHYKSTGVFFLEPAIFCQFLAIAIVIDMVYFRNWKRIILYICGIAVTFSGTGLFLLFLLVPFFLIEKRQFIALLLFVAAILSAPIWAYPLGLGGFVDRAAEFLNPYSSGFARFISMFFVLRDFIIPYPDKLFFGVGAGSISSGISSEVDYTYFDPTWGKVIYEYGAIAALAYFALLAALFTSAHRSRYVKAALLIQFLVLGGYIIPPTIHGLIVALIAWPYADCRKPAAVEPASS